MPTKPSTEVKRTKLVFLYSDEDENMDISNKSSRPELKRESYEHEEQQLPHCNKKAEVAGSQCNIKEVSTSSLMLHADLQELQEDAQHIKQRACESENINSDACTSKLSDFPFYEDIALPHEPSVTENVTQRQAMRVKEVEVETLPYVVRQRFTTDRHNYKNNSHSNNLRTHFTVEEFANTHMNCKRFRDGDFNEVNNNKLEERDNVNSNNVDCDDCKDNNNYEVNQSTTANIDMHIEATLALDTNQDAQNHNIVVTNNTEDNKSNNNITEGYKNDDNDDDDDDDDDDGSDEVVQVHCIKPIVSDDGKVHVVQSNGYCLTVNEEDLLDLSSESHETHYITNEVCKTSIDRPIEDENNNNVVNCQNDVNETNGLTELNSIDSSHENEGNAQDSSNTDDTNELKTEELEEEEDIEDEEEIEQIVEEKDDDAWEDDDEEYEEEESDDEELDQCLLVAIVDRLVECCESPDLDSNLNIEATRFCAAAKPLLTQLRNDEITHETFEKNIHKQLHQFMRVYKNVYKPRDAPIIINGVQMDL